MNSSRPLLGSYAQGYPAGPGPVPSGRNPTIISTQWVIQQPPIHQQQQHSQQLWYHTLGHQAWVRPPPPLRHPQVPTTPIILRPVSHAPCGQDPRPQTKSLEPPPLVHLGTTSHQLGAETVTVPSQHCGDNNLGGVCAQRIYHTSNIPVQYVSTPSGRACVHPCSFQCHTCYTGLPRHQYRYAPQVVQQQFIFQPYTTIERIDNMHGRRNKGLPPILQHHRMHHQMPVLEDDIATTPPLTGPGRGGGTLGLEAQTEEEDTREGVSPPFSPQALLIDLERSEEEEEELSVDTNKLPFEDYITEIDTSSVSQTAPDARPVLCPKGDNNNAVLVISDSVAHKNENVSFEESIDMGDPPMIKPNSNSNNNNKDDSLLADKDSVVDEVIFVSSDEESDDDFKEEMEVTLSVEASFHSQNDEEEEMAIYNQSLNGTEEVEEDEQQQLRQSDPPCSPEGPQCKETGDVMPQPLEEEMTESGFHEAELNGIEEIEEDEEQQQLKQSDPPHSPPHSPPVGPQCKEMGDVMPQPLEEEMTESGFHEAELNGTEEIEEDEEQQQLKQSDPPHSPPVGPQCKETGDVMPQPLEEEMTESGFHEAELNGIEEIEEDEEQQQLKQSDPPHSPPHSPPVGPQCKETGDVMPQPLEEEMTKSGFHEADTSLLGDAIEVEELQSASSEQTTHSSPEHEDYISLTDDVSLLISLLAKESTTNIEDGVHEVQSPAQSEPTSLTVSIPLSKLKSLPSTDCDSPSLIVSLPISAYLKRRAKDTEKASNCSDDELAKSKLNKILSSSTLLSSIDIYIIKGFFLNTLPRMEKEVMRYALTYRPAIYNRPPLYICIEMNMITKEWTSFMCNEISLTDFDNSKYIE